MSQTIQFTKMQGAGNDYVYINCFAQHIEDPNALAQWVSDRHFGIGSDGLVLIMPSDTCDFRMRMFNADGSEAEMCGNASRCIGKYVYDHHLTSKTEVSLETKAGVKILQLFPDADGYVQSVRVDMGEPILASKDVPVVSSQEVVVDEPIVIDGKEERMTCVSMGNPHAIYFVDDVAALNLIEMGPSYECHERFPRRTNSEFVEVIDRGHVKMRVWERGAGETLACGTGCCATLVACVLNNKTDRKATIDVVGGQLIIEWDETTNHVFMTGPATTVFEGVIQWNK